jgi:hypothetical protein
VQLEPHYAPKPPAVSRAQIEDYVRRYLDLAEQVPGGIEHTFIELTEALPIEKMRRRVAHRQE